MKWVAQVKSHGVGKVNKAKFPIGAVFDILNRSKRDDSFEFRNDSFEPGDTPDLFACRVGSSHLGFGNWDVYEVPESPEEYAEKQKACGIKVGDRVKVVRPYRKNTGGFNDTHISDPFEMTSKMSWVGGQVVCSVVGLQDSRGVHIKHGGNSYVWPYFCLEKVEVEAKTEKKERSSSLADLLGQHGQNQQSTFQAQMQMAGMERARQQSAFGGLLRGSGIGDTLLGNAFGSAQVGTQKIKPVTSERKTIMSLTKNWWKKYKLVSVIVFTVMWVPTGARLAYPLLLRLGKVIDAWMVRHGASPVNVGWANILMALLVIGIVCGLLWAAKNALVWLYDKV